MAEVKIGVLLPLTGPTAQTGEQMRFGVQLATDIINTATNLDMPLARTTGLPNLNGAKVVPVFTDHQNSPERASADVERLVNQDKVVALVGAAFSGVTLPASQVAERLGVPWVADTATSPRLGERGFKTWFRPSPHDGVFAADHFRFLDDLKKKGHAIETVGVVLAADEQGQQLRTQFQELAQKSGYKIAADISTPIPASELTSEVQRLKAANVDVVLASIPDPSTVTLLLRTARDLGLNPKGGFSIGPAITAPEFRQLVPALSLAVWGRSVWALDLASQRPLVTPVNDLFRTKSGNRDMSGDSARSMTAFLVAADAINRAGRTDPAAVTAALHQTNIPGSQLITPWGGIKFDANGENELGSGIILQVQQDGAAYTVWPFEVAAKPVIWPWPIWDKRP